MNLSVPCRATDADAGGRGESYESVLLPCDALGLVGVCVCETIDGASLASEETVEVGADLVWLTLFQVVALLAPGLEEVGTFLRVA